MCAFALGQLAFCTVWMRVVVLVKACFYFILLFLHGGFVGVLLLFLVSYPLRLGPAPP